MADPIEVTANNWLDPHPQAPKLADGEFGIKFVCVPAKRKDKDTVALLAAYRLPGIFNAIYGSRIPAALHVVAIHSATGRVYHNNAEPGHTPPLSAEMWPDPGPEPWGPGVKLDYYAGHFNLDLRGQLALENAAADYTVFVWLDEMVSAGQTVPVPASSTAPDFVAPVVSLAGLKFRKLAVSPAGGPVTIEVQPDGAIPMEIGPHLVGTLAADLLPKKGSPPAGRHKITFLGSTYLKRLFRAASVDFPQDAIDGPIPHFDMPVKNLVDLTTNSDKGADKGFLLVCVGKALSKVAVAKL